MLDDRPMSELCWQEQWELLKAERFVKQWNANNTTPLDEIPLVTRKQAGRPSHEIEKERGMVT